MSGQGCDPDVHALAVAVRAGPPRLGAGTRLICIDGPSGTGKTTLAGRLAGALSGRFDQPAPVVSTDDLLAGWADQFTFWSRLERQVLAPLRAGVAGSYRPYDWAAGQFRDEPVDVPVTGVVIVEGVSAARAAIRPEATLTILADAPAAVRQARARGRDDPATHAALERWWRAEDAWFAADGTAAAVDLVYRTG
ncbi:hypothetical protein GCM10010123_24230 [Pilimelia anulata]|uniref:Uridine kinase n=1 Tax=Pilimelia anulata TaxID=53371 RepID=A0A8J3B7F9_9ACTN|nr:hypothetical protein [Pilimelia anulata]GGJ93532.1 hypothetical protein GCM10010123_24230 [Pilimelia anulata]